MCDWSIVILTAMLVLVTVYYALQNKRMADEMVRTRSAQVLLPVLEILLKSARRRWRVAKFSPRIDDWTQDQRNVANRLSLDLERIAYICEQRLITPELIMDGHAAVFVSSWRSLAPFIADLRAQTGQPQRDHFERFAQQCESYLAKHGRPLPGAAEAKQRGPWSSG
jgi:hypothetical protein